MVNGGTITPPDYVIFDIGAGTRYGPWRLDAVLTNVFNKTYYYSDNGSVFSVSGENAVYPGAPRTFSLRAAYDFGGKRR